MQPWFTDALKRIVKTPILHFLDSGLLATVRGLSFDRIKTDCGRFVALLESFAFAEVLKLVTTSDLRLTSHHFRDRDGPEADTVLERDAGTIAGFAVMVSAMVKVGDFGASGPWPRHAQTASSSVSSSSTAQTSCHSVTGWRQRRCRASGMERCCRTRQPRECRVGLYKKWCEATKQKDQRKRYWTNVEREGGRDEIRDGLADTIRSHYDRLERIAVGVERLG